MNLADYMLNLTNKSVPKIVEESFTEILFFIKLAAKNGKLEYRYSCLGERYDVVEILINRLKLEGFKVRTITHAYSNTSVDYIIINWGDGHINAIS